ncbi:MAG TPA: hypothetical protein H9946_12380 [Candidatus Jeotgalibaca pullicola]|nr:hypothetical protein [Candidatus Jeotgalibaca pullicola]
MKKIRLIVFICILSIGTAYLYTFYFAVPMYRSTTQILVDQRNNDSGEISTGDINTNIKLIDTYKELITGPAILNLVKERMELDMSTNQLAKKISINAPENVQLFNISVSESDANLAAEIANTVAQTFKEKIPEIMQRVDNVVIVYEAVPSLTPYSPNFNNNMIRGGLIGITVSLGIVLLQYFLDDTLRNVDFVTEEIGWTNLGTVPEAKRLKTTKVPKNKKKIDKKDEIQHGVSQI